MASETSGSSSWCLDIRGIPIKIVQGDLDLAPRATAVEAAAEPLGSSMGDG